MGGLSGAQAGESGVWSCGRPKKYFAARRGEVKAPRLSTVTTRPKKMPVAFAMMGRADWN